MHPRVLWLFLLASCSMLHAGERWQFGPMLGGGLLHGKQVVGVEPASICVGAQIRWEVRPGHVLQGVLSGGRHAGERMETFTLDDGAPYAATLSASTALTLVSTEVEYHAYLGGRMGKGWHPFLGVGAIRVDHWRSPSHGFDMPTSPSTDATVPSLSVGSGYVLTRRWSLAVRTSFFKAEVLGTRVNPRLSILEKEQVSMVYTTLIASFWF